MNNIKKVAFSVLIAGLAFGFSAFKTIKRRSIYVYYKINMAYPLANDPRGYQYYSGDRCEPGGYTCSAQWNIGGNLPPISEGEGLPTSGVSFITGSVYPGHFE